MSSENIARRTTGQLFFSGVNITDQIDKYLLSISYTDKEEDETDDLQIKLQDRDGIWLEDWLNQALQAASDETITKTYEKIKKSKTKYKVIRSATVRDRPGTAYYVYGTLAYGDTIDVKSISDGWANFTFNGKNAYTQTSNLKAVKTTYEETSDEAKTERTVGLKIQAVFLCQNYNGDGKDTMLDSGTFELDAIDASGPPAVITIKGTSLPYNSTIRQTKKSRSWEDYKLSGILNDISENNGMGNMFLCSVDPKYKRVEQYKTSDIAFLQKLCHDEGYSLKITNNIIVVFDQEEYENKDPIKVITPGCGYTKYKLSTKSNDTYTSCRVSYINSKGKLISATAYIEGYDSKSEKNQRLEISQKVESVAEAKKLAQKMLRLHNKFELVASFTFPGDSSLVAGVTITLSKWGMWSGKYIIKEAKHTLDKSGYSTQITLRRVL